jgi:AraC family transcriptional regulator
MGSVSHRSVLIDYTVGVPSPFISYGAQLPLGRISFSRCTFAPNPGVTLGGTQSIIAVHSAPSFDMDWLDPERDALRRSTIVSGAMNVNRPDLPVFHHWSLTAKALVIAFDESFVAQTFVQAFDRDAEQLPVVIGMLDPTVQRFATLCDQEIMRGGAGGRLFAEGLVTSLLVHLFRSYGSHPREPRHFIGGLAPAQLRQVQNYIEDFLGEDLGLAELASLTGLSTHHFGQAFKASTGITPHRYVMERRIHRARELLISESLSIGEIAASVGFSSQSHLTSNFRKQTGLTPGLYRREFQKRRSRGGRRGDSAGDD